MTVNVRIFRTGQLTPELVQTKARVDALAQNAADVRLTLENHDIGAACVIGRDCGCHSGGASADDDKIVPFHGVASLKSAGQQIAARAGFCDLLHRNAQLLGKETENVR